MKVLSVLPMAALLACGGAAQKRGPQPLLPMCAPHTYLNGHECIPQSTARKKIADAQKSLADFDVEGALPLLNDAAQSGPHPYDVLLLLHEQRAIAYSYLKRETEALADFDTLLSLHPGHLLNYTLSPQTTFLFEQARKANLNAPRAVLHVSWPHGRSVSQEVPVTVEVISDPKGMLERMVLYLRYGDSPYRRMQFGLGNPGELTKVLLPAAHTQRPTVLQLYGSVYNDRGDEVLLWSSSTAPRDIPLSYRPPAPWYRKWWVWAIAGGTVATVTGATVYALSQEPSDTIGGTFSW